MRRPLSYTRQSNSKSRWYPAPATSFVERPPGSPWRAFCCPDAAKASISARSPSTGLRIVSVHADDNTVFVHRAGQIHHIPSGTTRPTEMLDELTSENGQATDYLEFVDTFLVAQIVGLISLSSE
jgi:hypothetical protein